MFPTPHNAVGISINLLLNDQMPLVFGNCSCVSRMLGQVVRVTRLKPMVSAASVLFEWSGFNHASMRAIFYDLLARASRCAAGVWLHLIVVIAKRCLYGQCARIPLLAWAAVRPDPGGSCLFLCPTVANMRNVVTLPCTRGQQIWLRVTDLVSNGCPREQLCKIILPALAIVRLGSGCIWWFRLQIVAHACRG